MYNSKLKNLELPENLFSNLGASKIKKVELPEETKEEFKEIEITLPKEIKYNKLNNKEEYRNRINRMYNELCGIEPVDNEISEELYTNDYNEKGIVIKPTVSELKQFWTEYRLINNEHKSEKQPQTFYTPVEEKNGEKDEFDTLFDALSKRVEEINDYIDELKEMRSTYVKKSNILKEEREKFNVEKEEFNKYVKEEKEKINTERENLKVNFSKLQTIIDDLNIKIEGIDK